MTTPPRRVLIADDDAPVRAAYRALFSRQSEFTLVGEARTGREAVAAYATARPDVVLMDLQMPEMTGIEATRAICDRWRDACVVAMTTFGSREYVVAALRAGAAGYLLKDAGGAAILAALRQAMAGDMPLSSAVRRELVSTVVADGVTEPEAGGHGLSPRQVELVGWLAHGLTNQQIATRMNLSEGSVKQYLNQVAEKWGTASRTQVLVRAIQLGVVDLHALPSHGG